MNQYFIYLTVTVRKCLLIWMKTDRKIEKYLPSRLKMINNFEFFNL